jgi:hypothetical protein
MSFTRWMVAVVLIGGSLTGCLASHDDASVRAINLRTGETRDFPDAESVPEGWGICADGETCT